MMALAPADALVRRLSRPNTLIAAALFRICVATYLLTLYLVHFGQRAALWGPDGVYPYATFMGGLSDVRLLSLYSLSASAWWAELLYWAWLSVAALYMIGIVPRLSGILLFVLALSLFSRNPWITDGGTTALRLTMFYLLFAETGCWFAVGAARRRAWFEGSTTLAQLARITHSFAIGACLVELAIIYLTSAFYKLEGHKWQDGTALYYILRCTTFDLTPLSGLVYRHPLLVGIATYGTLFAQLAFPWLMWWRKAKPYLFVTIASMHLGIALAMNLLWFSFVMIAADLLLFSDDMLIEAYRRVALMGRRLSGRWLRSYRPAVPARAALLDDLREPT